MKLANTLQTQRYTTVFHHDRDALNALISVFAPSDDPTILDCTYGYGHMWQGCVYQPDFKTDIRELPRLDRACDFCDLGLLGRKFEVIVWDPPHLPDTAKNSGLSQGKFADYFGLGEGVAPKWEDGGVTSYFMPFLASAREALVPKGIVLAKMVDFVNQGQYWWTHLDFILVAYRAGLNPVQAALKVNQAPPTDPRWVTQEHLRNAHAWWVVVRNEKPKKHPSMLVDRGVIRLDEVCRSERCDKESNDG